MSATVNRTDNTQYKGIDVLKFIMALFVVVLHTHPLYQVSGVMNFLTADVIARVAVPFFFTATGFLLEKQIGGNGADAKDVIRGYIRKILGLYCIWTMIYLPVIIYDKILDSDDTLIRGVLTIVRDFIFVGSYAHLWYLPAVAVGIAMVYFLRKHLGEHKTAVFLMILFLAGLLTQSYFGLLTTAVGADDILWKIMKAVKKVMVTCRNGVFFGSIFIYMGTWIARCNITIKRWKAVIGLTISLLIFIMEAACLWEARYVRESDMYIMLIPSVFFLMMLAKQTSVRGDTTFIRKMSMNIYYVHMYFKFIYLKCFGVHNINYIGLFWFTLSGALITAYLMYRAVYPVHKRKA